VFEIQARSSQYPTTMQSNGKKMNSKGGEKSRSLADVCLASNKAMRALPSSIVLTGPGNM